VHDQRRTSPCLLPERIPIVWELLNTWECVEGGGGKRYMYHRGSSAEKLNKIYIHRM
jgi:hypothetical protein